jgi:hypothetical protein
MEAVIKWTALPSGSSNPPAWPAFWALPIEGNFQPYSSQWPQQALGYDHHVEADFFEALPGDAGTEVYGGSMHDWYGLYGQTCQPQYCDTAQPHEQGQRTVPAGSDFSQYHRYGFLWVPATADADGFAEFFFDGTQVGTAYRWQQLTAQALPPPDGQPWAFGIIDQQHLFIILGTGPSQPMTVKSVDVWQANTSANISND